MFKFLSSISVRVYERYLTVEKNIKAGSNSFYDSFLDLLEEFFKYVLIDESYGRRETLGSILSKKETKEFLSSEIKIDDDIYKKLKNITQKINKHKHDKEKTIVVDTIVTYLKVLHELSCKYLEYKGIIVDQEFNIESVTNIFSEYEKENRSLRKTQNELLTQLYEKSSSNKFLQVELAGLEEISKSISLDKYEIEEQNIMLLKQINKLKDMKIKYLEDIVLVRIDAIGALIVGPQAFQNMVNK